MKTTFFKSKESQRKSGKWLLPVKNLLEKMILTISPGILPITSVPKSKIPGLWVVMPGKTWVSSTVTIYLTAMANYTAFVLLHLQSNCPVFKKSQEKAKDNKIWMVDFSCTLFFHKHHTKLNPNLCITPKTQQEIEAVVQLCCYHALKDVQSVSLCLFKRNVLKAASLMNQFLVIDLSNQHPDSTLKNWPQTVGHVNGFSEGGCLHHPV